MAARRNALGRGLGALIPGAPTPTPDVAPGPSHPPSATSAPAAPEPEAPGAAEIEIDRIEPNPDQPRRIFAEDQLKALTESIGVHGVLQPVVVRKSSRPDHYELIVGERRWRAARAAGLRSIPAVVAESQSSDLLELAIVENVQRHDLNAMELAHAYQALVQRGATQDEIGRQLSIARSSVANHLRLLELTREMQEDVEAERLSMGHAKALLQVANPERRRHLRDQIVQEALSVREAERRARLSASPAPSRSKRRASSEDGEGHHALSEALQRHLQARVRIRGGDKGRLEIEYSSGEDLDRIAGLLLEGV